MKMLMIAGVIVANIALVACRVTRAVKSVPVNITSQLRGGGFDREGGHQQQDLSLAVEQTVPAHGHACKSDDQCGMHARCDMKIGECATLKFGGDLRYDVAMMVLGFAVAGISLAAGVGGGGLNVPLLMVVLSFDAHVATAMSQAMLTGGALAAFIYNYRGKHPDRPERPLINYELASLIGASVVAGAQVGSVVHAMAPPAIILILLCVVLIDAARKGVKNALKVQKKEAEAAEQAEKVEDKAPGPADSEPAAAPDQHAEEVWARSKSAQMKLGVFWILCLGLIVGKNVFCSICTPVWWTITVAAVLGLGGFAYKVAHDLSKQHPLDEVDLDFTELAMPLLRMCVLAGALAALCGIGGGMVIGPILMEMKVPPPVTAATTATTLLVLASSTCLVYACRGTAPWRYAIALSVCAFLGAGTGKVLIGRWVKRTGKQSVIVWILAGITIVSTCLMATQGIKTVVRDGWTAFHFRNFCSGIRSDVSPQEETRPNRPWAPEIPHEQTGLFMMLAHSLSPL